MNVYVETNFVLELVFQQQQSASCELILQLCEAGRAQLVVPAYSLAELHEELIRQANNRRELQKALQIELKQFVRTTPYTTRIDSIQDIARLLIQSNEEEHQRYVQYRDRLLQIAEIVPLTATILAEAATFEEPYDLAPQDALVYTSVLTHLHQTSPSVACFLNRNSKDFDNPDIVDELGKYNCRLIARFDHGYNFINSRLQP